MTGSTDVYGVQEVGGDIEIHVAMANKPNASAAMQVKLKAKVGRWIE